jgi:Beta-lactamase
MFRFAMMILVALIALLPMGCASSGDDLESSQDSSAPGDDDDDDDDDDAADPDDDDDVVSDDDDFDPPDRPTAPVENHCHADFAELDETLTRWSADLEFSIVLVTADQVFYRESYGFDFDHVEALLSATKLAATTAIMTLVQDGYFELDDPVSDYLTYWPADKADVTIRNLLSHTSGLPGQKLCMLFPMFSLDYCVRRIASSRPQGDPGTVFNYGGTGLQVTGRIAEVVTGKTWAEIFQERLIDPLGLETFYYAAGSNVIIATSGFSGLDDYARLLQLHLGYGVVDGNRFLEEDLVRQMQVNYIEGLENPAEMDYGMGWWIMEPEIPGEDRTRFTAAGGWGALPWVDAERGYGGFILMRDIVTTAWELFDEIEPLIIEQIEACR